MSQSPRLLMIPRSRLHAHTLHGAAALRAVRSPWQALDAQARRRPLSLEALEAAGTLRPEQDVRAVVVYDGDTLVAIWPFAVDHLGPVRIARRLGGHIQAYDGLSISRHAPERGVEEAAWEALRSWSDVDVLRLDALVAGDALLELPGLSAWAQPHRRTSRVRLVPGRELLACQSKQRRKAVRRRQRQLEALGEVLVCRKLDPDARETAVFNAIHAKLEWLDSQGAPSPVLRSRSFQEALGAAARQPAERSGIEIFQLELDGTGIAWELGHVDGDSFLSFLGAYRSEHARLGLGVRLTLETVRWCTAQGLAVYDFLPPTTDFKRAWADHARAVSRAVVPLRARGRLVLPAVRDGRELAKKAWQRLVPEELAKAVLAS